jgi:hypothetical protein
MKPDLKIGFAALAIALLLGAARDLTDTQYFDVGSHSDHRKVIKASVADDPISAYQNSSVWNGSHGDALPPSKDTSPDQ